MTRRRTALAVSLGLTALAAAVVYTVMWVGYLQNWGWLHTADWSVLNAAHDVAVKHPVWVRFWAAVSFALGPVPLRLMGTVAAAAALVMRNVRAGLLLFACAPLSGFVTLVAKGLVNRQRPSTMLMAAPSTSFPSGHALEATAALLALLSFLLPMVRRSIGGVAIAVTALSLLLVGISRVALNVHYPSDVMAGWSLGYLYFLMCLLAFRPPTAFHWSRRSDPTGSKVLLDPKVGAT
ncbi:MAG TPA: phosphatase PAP2 family protein [Mycobacterium sp.]|nr:phosphatase PAP2 family protein [Mycobacterium sp.]